MNVLQNIKQLFWISRPISWVNTAFPFTAGYLIVNDWQVDALCIVGTIFFLIPYNLIMYGVNDVYDYESDIRNPRKNSIEGSIADKKMHSIILGVSFLLAVPFIAYILSEGNSINNLVFLISLFFVIAYSIKGLRFKEKPILDSLTSSVHFMSPMAYGLSFTSIGKYEIYAMLAFTAWGMASHAFGAIQDIIPDRIGGISSIATKFGARKTYWFSFILYAISIVAILAITPWGYAPLFALMLSVYILNIHSYSGITDNTSAVTNIAWRRFIWLNYFTGFVFTLLLVKTFIFDGV
jgi:4-hydroxybenzoate polyprenyltransferase